MFPNTFLPDLSFIVVVVVVIVIGFLLLHQPLVMKAQIMSLNSARVKCELWKHQTGWNAFFFFFSLFFLRWTGLFFFVTLLRIRLRVSEDIWLEAKSPLSVPRNIHFFSVYALVAGNKPAETHILKYLWAFFLIRRRRKRCYITWEQKHVCYMISTAGGTKERWKIQCFAFQLKRTKQMPSICSHEILLHQIASYLISVL